MVDRERKISKLDVDSRIGYCVFLVLMNIVVISIVFLGINEFSLDNARYFYSAVFQGYAALLALVITAILVTLQNMNSQRYNIEEKVYKILKKHFSTYIFSTIEDLKQHMDSDEWVEKMTADMKVNIKILLEDREKLISRTNKLLHNRICYHDQLKKHKSELNTLFRISLIMCILILFYSATALVFVNSDGILDVSSFHILFVCLLLVINTIVVFSWYLFKIIKTWEISTPS